MARFDEETSLGAESERLTTQMTHLQVLEIGELLDERAFRVRAVELYAQGPLHTVAGIEGARALVAGPKSAAYDVIWDAPVAYMIRDESYALDDPAPAPQPSNLHRLSASKFLDFVATSTWATAEHPGPLEHWCFVSGDHIVDVAALSAPRVVVLSSEEN